MMWTNQHTAFRLQLSPGHSFEQTYAIRFQTIICQEENDNESGCHHYKKSAKESAHGILINANKHFAVSRYERRGETMRPALMSVNKAINLFG